MQNQGRATSDEATAMVARDYTGHILGGKLAANKLTEDTETCKNYLLVAISYE